MSVVVLVDAVDASRFGAKAARLAAATRAGLPVPGGWALSHEAVAATARGEVDAVAALRAIGIAAGGTRLAVRSSGAEEDGAGRSFAGQYISVLNVTGPASLSMAVDRVHASRQSDAVRAYRARMGVTGDARMGVVIQRLVDATCAGVMFTVDPRTGEDARLIEASWGLGEAVAHGLVTPDRVRLARDGHILERSDGDKGVAVVPAAGGGVREVAADAQRAARTCLDDALVDALGRLADECEAVFGRAQDVEWAFGDGALYLLQVRPVTRTSPRR